MASTYDAGFHPAINPGQYLLPKAEDPLEMSRDERMSQPAEGSKRERIHDAVFDCRSARFLDEGVRARDRSPRECSMVLATFADSALVAPALVDRRSTEGMWKCYVCATAGDAASVPGSEASRSTFLAPTGRCTSTGSPLPRTTLSATLPMTSRDAPRP